MTAPRRHAPVPVSTALAAGILWGGIAAGGGVASAAPPGGPSLEDVQGQEREALTAAVAALLESAQRAEDGGALAAAAEDTAVAARLLPEDPDLADLATRRREAAPAAGGEAAAVPEEIARARAQARTRAARAIQRWGDWLAGQGGAATAAWAYDVARDLGCDVPASRRDLLRPGLDEIERMRREAQGTASRQGGFGRGSTSHHAYVYNLPGGWRPDRSWPILFLLHGIGASYGDPEDDEINQLVEWSAFPSAGFIVVSIRDPDMIGGREPNADGLRAAMEEAAAQMAVRFRADPARICLGGRGSGALACHAFFQANPGRVAAFEICNGKFRGARIPAGSPALDCPVRLGIFQGPYDPAYYAQTREARDTFQRLGVRSVEWAGDDGFQGKDLDWFRRAVAARVPRLPAPRGSRGATRR